MANWDTSTLVKLYAKEPDSLVFEAQAMSSATGRVASRIALYEARATFQRKEAEGILQSGAAQKLYSELLQDVATGEVRLVELGPDVEREYGQAAEECLPNNPPLQQSITPFLGSSLPENGSAEHPLLKPRRCSLFIASAQTPLISFCFSAARSSSGSQASANSRWHLCVGIGVPPRRRKTKRGVGGLRLAINLAPLRGLSPRTIVGSWERMFWDREDVQPNEFGVRMKFLGAHPAYTVALGNLLGIER